MGGGINGGFQMAMIGAAIADVLPWHPDPFAVSAHFVTPAVAGPVVVDVEQVRRGGRLTTVRANLTQGGEVRVAAVASFGDLASQSGTQVMTLPPVDMPPPEECIRTTDAPREIVEMAPFLQRWDGRLDPATAMWAVGKPSGVGMIQGWFRFAEERAPDPLSLLFTVDALPPITFDLGLTGWAPTIQLSAHVRRRPESGWLRVRHEARTVAGGFFEEDCNIWDSAGNLVAQSRQLALTPLEA